MWACLCQAHLRDSGEVRKPVVGPAGTGAGGTGLGLDKIVRRTVACHAFLLSMDSRH